MITGRGSRLGVYIFIEPPRGQYYCTPGGPHLALAPSYLVLPYTMSLRHRGRQEQFPDGIPSPDIPGCEAAKYS